MNQNLINAIVVKGQAVAQHHALGHIKGVYSLRSRSQ